MVEPRSPSQIVDYECNALLSAMQKYHTGAEANVGISLALFYPNDPGVPSFFHYGSAGPDEPITPKTIYGIGSVTKVFTGTLAAYLNVQNIIPDLRTPVGPFLVNSACSPGTVSGQYWNTANVLDFATQTSGLPDEANGAYADQLFGGKAPSCDQLAWWNDNQGAFVSNRGDWIYSSAGFVTLGFAIAGAANTTYPDLLTSGITSALEMVDTFVAKNVPAGGQVVQGYSTQSKPVPITGAADMKSTGQDMLAWLAAVYQAIKLAAAGSSMSPLQQAIAEATRVWIPAPIQQPPPLKATPFSMGLAWQIPTVADRTRGDYSIVVKNGAASGCSCWIGLTAYDSQIPPVGVALLTNQMGVSPDGYARAILQQIVACPVG
jgi:beta-lactamase class C